MGLDLMFYKYKGNKKVEELYDFNSYEFKEPLEYIDGVGNLGWGIAKNIMDLNLGEFAEIDEYLEEIFNINWLINYEIEELEVLKNLYDDCVNAVEDGYRVFAEISF